MSKKKNTFKSGKDLGLFTGTGKKGNNYRGKSKKGKNYDHGRQSGHYHPGANIGWLFAKDYYREIEIRKKEEEAGHYEAKNQGIINQKFSDYKETNRQLQMEFNGIQAFVLTTLYPGLVIGTGIPHESDSKGEFKIGFHFDFTTGLPVIPGSSVKGLLRSAFQQADGEYIKFLLDNKPGIDIPALEKEIFDGVKSVNGEEALIHPYKRDIFFEAIITRVGNQKQRFLDEDFITPHKSLFEDPVPLLFLKVLPRVTFLFQFRLQPGIISAEEKKELFERIIRDLGIGAKTNVGYGKFE